MEQCIFCQIIAGAIPAKKLFEDDKVVAVLDIYPASPGHILLLPKTHSQNVEELDEDVFSHMGVIAQRMIIVMIANLKAEGVSIVVQNGGEAEQKAPHFIMHLIPRYKDDKLQLQIPRTNVDSKELDEVYVRLKSMIEQTISGQKLR
ncbi:HIT family protein [Candidatus Woesearchaeota archaeon]|nr:HIT family protein [Candidatus Woesearchaeota archaeon]